MRKINKDVCLQFLANGSRMPLVEKTAMSVFKFLCAELCAELKKAYSVLFCKPLIFW